MRYGFTALACAALAATSLAAPVIDMRDYDVTVCTTYTTIVTTETISPSNAAPTPYYQPAYHSTRSFHHISKSFSSSAVAPTAPSSTIQSTTPVTTPEPVTTPTPEPMTTPPVVMPTSVPKSTSTTPTTTTSAAPAPAPANSFAAAILAAHNGKRGLHGCPDLIWDDTMASYAQSITDKCIWAHSGGDYGENLAAGYADGTAVVNAWYGEDSMYNYDLAEYSDDTGHFTQVVWKAAKKIGCASTPCNTKETPGDMVVCEYDTGNVRGFFKENVPRPL